MPGDNEKIEPVPTPKPTIQPPAPDRGRFDQRRPPDPRPDRGFSRSSRHRGQWNKKNKG